MHRRHHDREPNSPHGSLLLAVSVGLLGLGIAFGADEADPVSIPTTLLVEGRVALKVPALWAVQRITSGPGSARVQVMAPDNSIALYWSRSRRCVRVRRCRAPRRRCAALSTVSRRAYSASSSQRIVVRIALSSPIGNSAVGARPTGRCSSTARVRIAIGCQSPPGDEEAVRHVCEEAIRSAHTVV